MKRLVSGKKKTAHCAHGYAKGCCNNDSCKNAATGVLAKMKALASSLDAAMGHRRKDMHVDRKGRPITLGEWAALFEDDKYRYLKQTTTKSGYWISTIWLGFSSSKYGPETFESMVWRGTKKKRANVIHAQDRYGTEEEALLGHRKLVARFRRAPRLKVVR